MANLKIPGRGPVKIVIADEAPAFCENLRRLLKAQDGLEVVGEAHDADSAAALLAQFAPQVLLLDFALCRQLHGPGAPAQGSCPQAVRELVILAAPEKEKVIESFRLGAQGIVLKRSARRTWYKSIAAVVSGQYWLGNESLAVLIEAIREVPSFGSGASSGADFGLTPREIEIVRKIASGRSNKEVGRDFSIRERTVKHHLTNIFGKVGVSSRLELALFARDHQILTIPASSDFASAPDNVWRQEESSQPMHLPAHPNPKSVGSE